MKMDAGHCIDLHSKANRGKKDKDKAQVRFSEVYHEMAKLAGVSTSFQIILLKIC